MEQKKNKQEEIFTIEDAKPEDIEVMRTLVKDAWLEFYPNETYGITYEDVATIDWYSDLERRRKDLTDRKDTIHAWVIRNEKGEVVGFCKVTKEPEGGEIDGIYVAPELKGKGWGKKLLQKAEGWLGNVDIKLKVVHYNTAVGFYKKMGFEATGRKVNYEGTKLPSGKYIPRIEMLKKKS